MVFHSHQENQTAQTNSGKMVWNDELKMEIPDGWLVKFIPDFLNILTGKKDANFATENGVFPFFTCASKIYCCDEFAFEGKSILIAGNGDFNVKCYDGKFNAYQRTYVLIPNEEKYYSLIFMRVCDELEILKKSSRGSIIKFITIGDIQNIGLAIPKNGNDDLFEKLNTLTKLISENIKQNQELASLRDWLLPMLMNGQVSVGGVEVEDRELGMVADSGVEYKKS